MWKEIYAEIWTLLRMYTWNVPPPTRFIFLNTPLSTSHRRRRRDSAVELSRVGGAYWTIFDDSVENHVHDRASQ